MQIHEILAFWYQNIKRDLPWRDTCDPYKIWLSEIILQQTRVQQGIPYYNRIISAFPDIFSLALADTDTVLKFWQGLGYYTRARNMHETAKYIATELKGNFPGSYDELIKLKGIGPYTAAAIASIAFNQPVAAIDGNVSRILSRLFLVDIDLKSGKGKTLIKHLAESILDKKHPGQHNQALMELGSMICLPAKPGCVNCPVKIHCLAFRDNKILEIPVKYRKKKTRERYFNYFIIISDDGKIIMSKRDGNDIWKGLYEPALAETPVRPEPTALLKIFNQYLKVQNADYTIIKISPEIRHILSHQHIIARFVHVRMKTAKLNPGSKLHWISMTDLSNYPVPRLIDRYFSSHLI